MLAAPATGSPIAEVVDGVAEVVGVAVPIDDGCGPERRSRVGSTRLRSSRRRSAGVAFGGAFLAVLWDILGG